MKSAFVFSSPPIVVSTPRLVSHHRLHGRGRGIELTEVLGDSIEEPEYVAEPKDEESKTVMSFLLKVGSFVLHMYQYTNNILFGVMELTLQPSCSSSSIYTC